MDSVVSNNNWYIDKQILKKGVGLMKVYIKNKILSWGGGSDVLGEDKQVLYKVKGKVFSPTRKKRIYDKKNAIFIFLKGWP